MDDEVVHGKFGGAPLDAMRTNAMLKIAMSASLPVPMHIIVPLIEIVLFGHSKVHARDNGISYDSGFCDIPSSYELSTMTLEKAKALCVTLRAQSPQQQQPSHAASVDVHAPGGSAVVIDLYSCAASAEAADVFSRTGLNCTSIFGVNQLKNSCMLHVE